MLCPVDATPLVMTDRSGVEIDYCPKCRGVWLDRGELDKIIDRSAAQTPAAPVPATPVPPAPPRQGRSRDEDDDRDERDERYDRDGYPRRKRRESFLGDLFDF